LVPHVEASDACEASEASIPATDAASSPTTPWWLINRVRIVQYLDFVIFGDDGGQYWYSFLFVRMQNLVRRVPRVSKMERRKTTSYSMPVTVTFSCDWGLIRDSPILLSLVDLRDYPAFMV
jgi:hypothetical protein